MVSFDKNCFKSPLRRKNIPKDDNETLALFSLKLAKEAPTYVVAPVKKHINKFAETILSLHKNLNEKCYNYRLAISENDRDITYLKEKIVEELGSESILLTYLNHGFIIHHASLPENVKIAIENALRNKKINLVIATSTLAQGVNLPFKNILFKSLWMGKDTLIPNNDFLNACGRAGRANEENYARVLCFIGKDGINKNYKTKKFIELLTKKQDLKSILNPIITKLNENWQENKGSFEKYCFELIERTKLIEIFNEKELENIDIIDSQLLAFVEENLDELEDSELASLIVKISLYYFQEENNENKKKLSTFIKSRLYYLKKEYSTNKARKRAYIMGLSLKDCKLIENNYELFKKIFLEAKDWNLNHNTKINILLKIALITLRLDTLKYSGKENLKEILTLWINGESISNIIQKIDNPKINDIYITNFIIHCQNMIPWGITSILNFIKMKSKDFNEIPKICYYFSEMFKYGIFDLNTVILLPIFKNLSFCNEILEFVDNDFDISGSIEDQLIELYQNELINNWPKEKLDTYINCLSPVPNIPEVKIRVNFRQNVPLKLHDYIYLLVQGSSIILYDFEGNELGKIKKEDISLKLNSTTTWIVTNIEDSEITIKQIN